MKTIKCNICSFESVASNFTRHVKEVHLLSPLEYYLKYIGIQKICAATDCENNAGFVNISTGFHTYCSLTCCYKKGTERNLKNARARKGKTFIELYGEERAKIIKEKSGARTRERLKDGMPQEQRDKISKRKIGIPRPRQMCINLSIKNKGKSGGAKNPNWKGGITVVSRLIGASLENTAWRRSLFIENSKCFICGSQKDCEAHHLEAVSVLIRRHGINKENWRDFSDILFDRSNGIVLCNAHHNSNSPGSFHQVLGRIDITTEHFIYYLLWLDVPEKVDLFIEKYFNENNNQSKT